MNKLATTLCALLLIQGCAAAVMAGAASTGLVVYDKRDVKTIAEDKTIKYKVHSRITERNEFDGSHVVVSSFNNVVLLAGQVPSASLKVTAEKIAKMVPDVKRVYNEINIAEPTDLETRSKDTWITTKVKTQMIAEKNLNSATVKVVTENGTVYLMGKVKKQQADLAVDIARRVSGVQKVVKVFNYA